MGKAKGATGTGQVALLLGVLDAGWRRFRKWAPGWSSRSCRGPGAPPSAFMPHPAELKDLPWAWKSPPSWLAPWWAGCISLPKGPTTFPSDLAKTK